jgi:hypothetical protein
VPAAAMISVETCWSRMSSRLTLVKNGPLATDSTTNRIRNGKTMAARRSRAGRSTGGRMRASGLAAGDGSLALVASG